MENAAKVAEISLNNARSCLVKSNYGRAFANYLLYLKLETERDEDVYNEFAFATKEWCEELEERNRIEDLFKCFDQACEIYPDHDTVLNNIGAQLFRLGYIEEAAAYIRRSLIINPNYLAARDNLENICSHLVERWHFSMLNDKHRNVAYKFAIDKAVKSGYDTVLDIGTGTGILSLMCEFSGARSVTACDRSQAMVDVARDVLRDNGVQNRINLVHKLSTDMKLPEDMPEKVRLVVTETFDAGLFGEHIVSTLSHAWKNLVSTSPMGTVIPCGATMYVCGIECETIRKQNRMVYPVLQCLDLSTTEILSTTSHVPEEPYTTENLSNIRGGYRILTNIAELLRVSFCNLCELESLNKGKDWISNLYVKQHGRLDALVVWFDLHLDDTVTISTAAESQSCWEQAIYPITSVTRLDPDDNRQEKCQIKKKEKLQAVFHFKEDCLRLVKCEIPASPRPEQRHIRDKSVNHSTCSSGLSVSQCETSCLPFRKRKVEEITGVDTSVSCVGVDQTISNTDHDRNMRKTSEKHARDSVKYNDPTADLCRFDFDLQSEADDNVAGLPDDVDDISDEPVYYDAPAECVEGCADDCQVNDDSRTSVEAVLSTYQSLHKSLSGSSRENSSVLTTDIDVHLSMEQCTIKTAEENGAETDVHHSMSDDSQNKIYTCSDSWSRARYDKIGSISEKQVFLADQVDIEHLNDIQLNKHYCQVLQECLTQRKGQKLSLLIISQRLSFLAIQALKLGYQSVTMATNADHLEFIMKVAEVNGCKEGEITLIDWQVLCHEEVTADVILCDIVEPCGALRQQVFEDMAVQRLTSLSPGGVVLPGEVKIQGMFIESERLDNISHVTGDDRTLGFQIAKHINVFEMQNHVNIDLTMLPHTKLSEVFLLFTVDLQSPHTDHSTSLHQSLEKSVEAVNSGKISALVYWFEMQLSNDVIINTLDSRCHWRQAGVIIKGNKTVMAKQKIVSKLTLQNSCLDVDIIKPDTTNGFSHSV